MAEVTLFVDKDEWYPVWSARRATEADPKPYGDPIEVDSETADRWARVFAEFDAVQEEIIASAEPASVAAR